MDQLNLKTEAQRYVSQHPLFKNLTPSSITELVKSSKLHSFPKGSVLFFQNDPAEGFYLVVSGAVMILLTSPDGHELIISEMQPGDSFGELAIITGKARSTTAITHEKTVLLTIPSRVLLQILDKEPVLVRRLLESIARLMYVSNEREAALAFMDAPGRMARALRMLDQAASSQGYITISQEELARRTGLTRQTVAKILGRWRHLGWLLTGRGRIVLLNVAELEKIERQPAV